MPIEVKSGEPGGSPLRRGSRRVFDLIADLEPMQEATDLPDLFAALARSVVRALHADACLVSELTGDVLRDVAASVRPPARLKAMAEEHSLARFPALRSVVERGHSVEISLGDLAGPVPERSYLHGAGFARLLVCPLRVDGKVTGIVEVFRKEDRAFRRDDSREVGLLVTFAANSYTRLRLATKLESHYTETLEALAAALDAKDPYTHQHTRRMNDMATALAIAMQVPAEERRAVRLGAILHDVGKIGISDSILLKEGPLTEAEWEVMRRHPLIGERMLKGIDFIRPALPTIRHHHERWDGRGYPDGLAAHEIPLGARIVAVCDAFDAMTSDRPYRKAMAASEACRELLRCAGAQFDPTCAALLVDVIHRVGDDNLEEKFVRYAS